MAISTIAHCEPVRVTVGVDTIATTMSRWRWITSVAASTNSRSRRPRPAIGH